MPRGERMPRVDDHLQRIRAIEAIPTLPYYHIKVFADDELVVAGDRAFVFGLSQDMEGKELIAAEAYVSTAPSGNMLIQVRNGAPDTSSGTDMLTTRLRIDSGEFHTKTSSVPAVIDAANAGVAWGDFISIDVDAAGSVAKGLGVMLIFGVAGILPA